MLDQPRHDDRRLEIFISPPFIPQRELHRRHEPESASLLRPTLLRADASQGRLLCPAWSGTAAKK